ncbi:hypothetical protein QNN00_12895 [Bacillus velezensis]|nr:hypothetical protein [Bacillus velezensis]
MCWQVLEDAGYTKEQLENLYNGRVGVLRALRKTGTECTGKTAAPCDRKRRSVQRPTEFPIFLI